MTEKVDQEKGEAEGEVRLSAARRFTRGAYIQRGRPQAAVAAAAAAAVDAVEHIAKATPTQRMNGRQRGVLCTYLRIYVRTQVT